MKNIRIFVTSILPEAFIAKYNLSFAACNFSSNIISGNVFDEVYSIMPLYVGGDMEAEAFSDSRFELVYDKLRKKGNFWQKLAVFKEQWTIFNDIPRNASIWFYNLNTLNAFLFILIKIFKPSVKLNVIVLDFTPVDKGFGLNQIYLKFINSAHGRILLANSSLFNSNNSVVLPGVVPKSIGLEPLIIEPNNKYLLSGVLNEQIAQTSMVLKTFSELPQCELHITGTIDDDSIIKEYCDRFSNIIYHGKLSFKDYLDVMHSCSFQLSTRHPDYPENQCNFPSKIIETLLHNRIVISTIEYPQLKDIKYFQFSSDMSLFKTQIEQLTRLDILDLLEYANQGKKVAEMFSSRVWNEAMCKIENAQ